MIVSFLDFDHHGNHRLLWAFAGEADWVRIVEKLDHGQVALGPFYGTRGQQRSRTNLGPGHDGVFRGQEIAPQEHGAHMHLRAQLDGPDDCDVIAFSLDVGFYAGVAIAFVTHQAFESFFIATHDLLLVGRSRHRAQRLAQEDVVAGQGRGRVGGYETHVRYPHQGRFFNEETHEERVGLSPQWLLVPRNDGLGAGRRRPPLVGCWRNLGAHLASRATDALVVVNQTLHVEFDLARRRKAAFAQADRTQEWELLGSNLFHQGGRRHLVVARE